LENLDKKENKNSINNAQKNDQIKDDFDIFRFSSFDKTGLSSSSTLCSENSSISYQTMSQSVSNDVKSILKKKLLDAAQRIGSKESKNFLLKNNFNALIIFKIKISKNSFYLFYFFKSKLKKTVNHVI
jgi:hypothetical protein